MDDLAFTQTFIPMKQTITKILAIVQDLDPPGVGARSLEESFKLFIRTQRANPKCRMATAFNSEKIV